MEPNNPSQPGQQPHSHGPSSDPPSDPIEVASGFGAAEAIVPPPIPQICPDPDSEDYGQPWGFWMTCLWGLAIAAIVAVVSLLISLPFLVIKMSEAGIDSAGQLAAQKALEYDGLFAGIMSLITIPVIVGSCFFFARLRRKNGITPKTYLALKNPGWKAWIIWPVIWWVSMMGVDWVLTAAGAPEVNPWMEEMAQNTTHFWGLLFAVVIGAPLIEEFFFRGFLFSGWMQSMRRRMPSFAAVLLTVLLTNSIWTVIHGQYDIYGLTAVFSLGIVLSVSRVVTGSLWVPIYLHLINNAFASYAMWEMMKEAKLAG